MEDQNRADQAGVPMPQYQCRKRVWALKISKIEYLSDIEPGPARLLFADDGFAPQEMPGEFMSKHSPKVGGYLVFYGDGYQSFSPAKAFEDGYTRIEG